MLTISKYISFQEATEYEAWKKTQPSWMVNKMRRDHLTKRNMKLKYKNRIRQRPGIPKLR